MPDGAGQLLVVDDQPLVAEFLVSAAEEAGWVAEAACSVEEFERKLKSSQPEVIVLDLTMPDRTASSCSRISLPKDFLAS